jgi:hypothetical protein
MNNHSRRHAAAPYQFMMAGSDVDRRAGELLAQMTREEKIGQMVQADLNALRDRGDISKYALGSMLSGGSSAPADIAASGWAQSCDELQAHALRTGLRIPLVCGSTVSTRCTDTTTSKARAASRTTSGWARRAARRTGETVAIEIC